MSDSATWAIIVGCILGSFLENETKRELIDFVRLWEERSTLYDD